MRKTKLFSFLLTVAILALALTACSGECKEHADKDGNGLCDVCEAEVKLPDGFENVCTDHGDTNEDGKCDICQADMPIVCDKHVDENKDGKCDVCQADVPVFCETHLDKSLDGKCDTCGEEYETISVNKALEICGDEGNITTERYYIRAKIDTVSNAQYGEMTVSDDTGSIYVYGTYDYDGVKRFSELAERPVKGDEVVLHCILQNRNGTKEIKNARLIGFVHHEADISDYTSMSVPAARDAAKGELIIVEGIVGRITYADGMIPSGFILIDGASSIYVYGVDAAADVSSGNKVKVAGTKDYWILDSETNSAKKFGYLGCNQLADATVLENDGKSNEFAKDLIPEITVKELLETPFTEDVTTSVYKVNALVEKKVGTGFVNYYIKDIDGVTGTYTYTQCSGSDFGWLDSLDGKICTVYITILNAKSSATGCVWRFLPIAAYDEGYTFNTDDAAEYAVKYHALDQFKTKYTADPALELVTEVSSELLGITGATLSYTSSDPSIISFTKTDDKVVMSCLAYGTVTVTVIGEYNGKTYEENITIEYAEPEAYEYITVGEAIDAEIDTVVTVKGIVGPSLVNQSGFYLIDESGVIAIHGTDALFEGLSIGNEVIIRGTRGLKIKDGYTCAGQIYVHDSEILANDYKTHEYSTSTFVTDVTIDDFYKLDVNEQYSTTVFVLEAEVFVKGDGYSTSLKLLTSDGKEVSLYCSSANQYEWLKAYNGQTVTLELAACNWNSKSYYAGCAIAVVNEDGTKVYNELNFDH